MLYYLLSVILLFLFLVVFWWSWNGNLMTAYPLLMGEDQNAICLSSECEISDRLYHLVGFLHPLHFCCGHLSRVLYSISKTTCVFTIQCGSFFNRSCHSFISCFYTFATFTLQSYCFFLRYASIWAKIVFECAIFMHFAARSCVGHLPVFGRSWG